MAQLASALAWGARGRKFESSHPDRDKTQSTDKQLVAFFYLGVVGKVVGKNDHKRDEFSI